MLVADPAEREFGLKLAYALLATAVVAGAQTPRIYQDPQKRFEFAYPAEFGAPSAGTDNGFRDRVRRFDFRNSQPASTQERSFSAAKPF